MERAIVTRLAQSVERQAFNLVVGGSSPPVGVFLFPFGILFLRQDVFKTKESSNRVI